MFTDYNRARKCCLTAVASALILAALPLRSADAFHLATFSDHQEAIVYVNGFPISEFTETNSLSMSSTLSPYFIKGTNWIVVKTTDTALKVASDPSIVRVSLSYGTALEDRTQLFILERFGNAADTNVQETISFKADAGFDVASRGVLHRVHSYARFDPVTRESLYRLHGNGAPNVIETFHHTTNALLDSLPWQGAPVALAVGDRTEITQLIQSIHDALTAENADALLPLLRKKNERLATASEMTIEAKEAEVRQFFQGLFDDAGFTFDPLAPQNFQFHSYETANLVRVQVNGQPPIQGVTAAFRYKMPIMVSRVGGVWVVVD